MHYPEFEGTETVFRTRSYFAEMNDYQVEMMLFAYNQEELNRFEKEFMKFIDKVFEVQIWNKWFELGEKMSEKDLKLSVINNADAIAKALIRGRDVEIRKSASGISVAEISKRVVAK